ncbi:MAG: NADPH-dependent oxidoreductase [Alphaproteobacteria bacterium]|nr:MAG: NADPH-dependent oxidoreductase [Alphaproteobacteria bacterium]
MLNFALIIGSTRPNRFADIPARWIVEGAKSRGDFTLETLDLRDHPLPLFNEPAPVGYVGGKFTEQAAEAWRHRIGAYDGFIVTAAEYNHAPTGVLKNAFDSASYEWIRKPISFVGYGGVGGARAIEHLRGIAVELQMAPIKQEVNIAMAEFLGVVQQGKTLDDYAHLVASRTAIFDNMVWWGNALKAAKAADVVEKAA